MICSKAYRTLGLLKRTFGRFGTIEARKISLPGTRSFTTDLLLTTLEPIINQRHFYTGESTRACHKVYFKWLCIQLQTKTTYIKVTPTDVYSWFLQFVKCLKQPSDHFSILDHVTFSTGRTRSATVHKLLRNYSSNNRINNSYFNRLPRLWNALPPINTELHFTTIK